MDATIAGDRLSPIVAFVRVVETGSFTAAASALGLSKSQISRSVKGLEDRLGVRLLHRTTRAVTATEAGMDYFARCSRILAELEEAEQAVLHLQAAPRGTLRVSLPHSFGVRYLSPLLSEFLTRYPEMRIEASFSERRVDLVDEGYDLAVRIGSLDDSSLIARRLGKTGRFVVGSPAYLAARGEPKSARDLRDHDCLHFSYQQSGATWQLREGGEDISVRVSGRLMANSGEALMEAALAGLGLAWLPDFVVADAIHSGRLVPVLPDLSDSDLPIWAVYPHSRHLAPKVRLFVEHLHARLGDCPPWACQRRAGARPAPVLVAQADVLV